MGVTITKEDLVAYAEVDYIIKHMNQKYIEKVPGNLLKFFETMKDPDHEVNINPYKPLAEQGLLNYTLEIIALLHVKFWCEDPARREQLIEKMKENERKFDVQLREKFNAENLFDDTQEEKNKISTQDPVTTVYSKYAENNPDIQDYTDIQESTKEISENIPIPEKDSLWMKLKNIFSRLFKK